MRMPTRLLKSRDCGILQARPKVGPLLDFHSQKPFLGNECGSQLEAAQWHGREARGPALCAEQGLLAVCDKYEEALTLVMVARPWTARTRTCRSCLL